MAVLRDRVVARAASSAAARPASASRIVASFARSSRIAVATRAFSARASRRSSATARARSEASAASTATSSRGPMARSSLALAAACARVSLSSVRRRSWRVRRTQGAHAIGRSGICEVGGERRRGGVSVGVVRVRVTYIIRGWGGDGWGLGFGT